MLIQQSMATCDECKASKRLNHKKLQNISKDCKYNTNALDIKHGMNQSKSKRNRFSAKLKILISNLKLNK